MKTKTKIEKLQTQKCVLFFAIDIRLRTVHAT